MFQSILGQTTRQKGRNTVAIGNTAPFRYLFIPVKVVPLEQSLLVINKILRLFVNTLTVNDKQYLLNRDNLTEPFQIQLSQKQKTFCQFFFAFLKSILNFKHLPK